MRGPKGYGIQGRAAGLGTGKSPGQALLAEKRFPGDGDLIPNGELHRRGCTAGTGCSGGLKQGCAKRIGQDHRLCHWYAGAFPGAILGRASGRVLSYFSLKHGLVIRGLCYIAFLLRCGFIPALYDKFRIAFDTIGTV